MKTASLCLEGKGTRSDPARAVKYLEELERHQINDTDALDLLSRARNMCEE